MHHCMYTKILIILSDFFKITPEYILYVLYNVKCTTIVEINKYYFNFQ